MAATLSSYSWLQRSSFWLLWGLTFLPAYCAAYGSWLIGSQIFDYHEPVDLVLTVVFLLTLLLIAAIIVYAGWHFYCRTRSFRRLLGWLFIGLLLVPLLSMATALTFYIQMNDIVIALN